MKIRDEAMLGLATTAELLQELQTRGETEPVHRMQGRSMARHIQAMLDLLPDDMLNYRTVDGTPPLPVA